MTGITIPLLAQNEAQYKFCLAILSSPSNNDSSEVTQSIAIYKNGNTKLKSFVYSAGVPCIELQPFGKGDTYSIRYENMGGKTNIIENIDPTSTKEIATKFTTLDKKYNIQLNTIPAPNFTWLNITIIPNKTSLL